LRKFADVKFTKNGRSMAHQTIKAAQRTENITYAIRDILLVADEVAKTGKKNYST